MDAPILFKKDGFFPLIPTDAMQYYRGKGERIAVVGYTPGMLASVPRGDREVLWALQFPLPLEEEDAVPEVYINALSVCLCESLRSILRRSLFFYVVGVWQEVIANFRGGLLFQVRLGDLQEAGPCVQCAINIPSRSPLPS